MSSAWERLLPRLQELADLSSAIKLHEYDQAVSMPATAGPARARTIATLESIAHDKLTAAEIGHLIEGLGDEELDEVQRASLRVLRKEYEKATRVPKELVRELAELRGLAYQAWTEARPASDFRILQPHLERLVALKKQEADAIGWAEERYDALLDTFEPEMRTCAIETMFDDLLDCLMPLAHAILDAAPDHPTLFGDGYERDKQKAFSEWLLERVGFDTAAGRLDSSPHPFTLQIAPGDVRLTTRTDEDALLFSIYATLHEAGHALYEQGIPRRFADLPVGDAPSLGMHESQSRLWENQVGRSRAFTDFMLPQLKEYFSEQLGMLAPDAFHKAVNHPRRTLIRVSADEVTYNLHVALRFEIELALFRDELEVADLPDAWDAGMEKYLGIRPDTQADGVLQDMHWAIGALGYFPTYTLGTLYSAAFFEKASDDLGDLDDELRRGDCSTLLGWLRSNIYDYGYLYPAKELAEKVLGAPLTARPFCSYIEKKYGELYDVSLP